MFGYYLGLLVRRISEFTTEGTYMMSYLKGSGFSKTAAAAIFPKWYPEKEMSSSARAVSSTCLLDAVKSAGKREMEQCGAHVHSLSNHALMRPTFRAIRRRPAL